MHINVPIGIEKYCFSESKSNLEDWSDSEDCLCQLNNMGNSFYNMNKLNLHARHFDRNVFKTVH